MRSYVEDLSFQPLQERAKHLCCRNNKSTGAALKPLGAVLDLAHSLLQGHTGHTHLPALPELTNSAVASIVIPICTDSRHTRMLSLNMDREEPSLTLGHRWHSSLVRNAGREIASQWFGLSIYGNGSLEDSCNVRGRARSWDKHAGTTHACGRANDV